MPHSQAHPGAQSVNSIKVKHYSQKASTPKGVDAFWQQGIGREPIAVQVTCGHLLTPVRKLVATSIFCHRQKMQFESGCLVSFSQAPQQNTRHHNTYPYLMPLVSARMGIFISISLQKWIPCPQPPVGQIWLQKDSLSDKMRKRRDCHVLHTKQVEARKQKAALFRIAQRSQSVLKWYCCHKETGRNSCFITPGTESKGAFRAW